MFGERFIPVINLNRWRLFRMAFQQLTSGNAVDGNARRLVLFSLHWKVKSAQVWQCSEKSDLRNFLARSIMQATTSRESALRNS
jgi:hypothetical protein